jgi:hypothetical protein
MPLVQIDMDRSLLSKKEEISGKVHQAFIDSLAIPADDKFQIFRQHDTSELVFDPGYGGVDRQAMVSIQVTMVHMYPVSAKKELYRQIAKRLGEVGVRHEDILISVIENGFEDWYAGGSLEG